MRSVRRSSSRLALVTTVALGQAAHAGFGIIKTRVTLARVRPPEAPLLGERIALDVVAEAGVGGAAVDLARGRFERYELPPYAPEHRAALEQAKSLYTQAFLMDPGEKYFAEPLKRIEVSLEQADAALRIKTTIDAARASRSQQQ